jgi:hypothetical protein
MKKGFSLPDDWNRVLIPVPGIIDQYCDVVDIKGIHELISFFRSEGKGLGQTGDIEGWTPIETAVHFLKQFVKLQRKQTLEDTRDRLIGDLENVEEELSKL